MDTIIPLNIIPDVCIKNKGVLPQTHIISELFDVLESKKFSIKE